jgi:hypothetical protein
MTCNLTAIRVSWQVILTGGARVVTSSSYVAVLSKLPGRAELAQPVNMTMPHARKYTVKNIKATVGLRTTPSDVNVSTCAKKPHGSHEVSMQKGATSWVCVTQLMN